MRITRDQLQELVNEEISRALLLKENRSLIEAAPQGNVYSSDASSLLEFVSAHARMGVVLQEQLQILMEDPQSSDLRPQAVDLIEKSVGGLNGEIDEAIATWRETRVF